MDSVFKIKIKYASRKKTNEIGLHADIIMRILHAVRKKTNLEMFSASMTDIDKTFNVKPKIKLKTIILEQYWDYLNVFNENENQSITTNSWEKYKSRNRHVRKKKPTVL